MSDFVSADRCIPSDPSTWLFPADSASGHIIEHKEDRCFLSKWGNDLRQTYRTIATPAGVSELDARMLKNHSVPGVNAGYITRQKLLEDLLRAQQQAIGDTALQRSKVRLRKVINFGLGWMTWQQNTAPTKDTKR